MKSLGHGNYGVKGMRAGLEAGQVGAYQAALSKSMLEVSISRMLAVIFRRCALMLVLLVLCGAVCQVFSQDQAPASNPGEHRKTSEPYTGDLSIFESPGREQRLQIERVMDILGITAGKAVADIGAGSGWFTVRAARRVGESGTVYAEDINPEAVHYIEARAQKEHLSNVKTILGKADDPLLPASSVDAILLLKTYHEVAEPVALLGKLRASLRSGARVGIIDRNGNGEDHGVERDVVLSEAGQAGYRLLKQYDFVKGDKMDYFLVLVPRE